MARNSSGGTTDKVYTTAGGILPNSNGPFTISLWFKSNSTSQTDQTLWMVHGGGPHWDIIYEYVDNKIEFTTTGAETPHPRTGSDLTISDTNWHHICYRKAASGASAWDKFLDGVKTQINASIDFSLPYSDRIWTFTYVGGASSVNGALAWLAVWDTALTDAEIIALAEGGNALMTQPEHGVFCWTFGGSSPEPDSFGSLDGTVDGTTVVDDPTGVEVYAYPPESDVRQGIIYGGGSYLGSCLLPAEADVRDETQYGGNGTEYTGTLEAGGGSGASYLPAA